MPSLRNALLGLILAMSFCGCAGMQITTDYDAAADFADLKTYAWLPKADVRSPDPRIDQSLLESRLNTAVDETLAAKGYTKDESGSPDFLVGYHAAIRNKIDIYSMNDFYGYDRGWGWRGSNVHVYEYEEGSLILDVVDAETNRLLWRGGAQAEINTRATPEQREQRIRDAVEKILENFPPD